MKIVEQIESGKVSVLPRYEENLRDGVISLRNMVNFRERGPETNENDIISHEVVRFDVIPVI